MMKRIIGVMLVKDEDAFIRKAIQSISNFVDELIVIDNGSTDNTAVIAEQCGAEVFREPDLTKTHDFITPYIWHKDTWIFGVDGDEIFDPEGLKRLRKDIDSGVYDGAYQVQGWYLHADVIQPGLVTGHMGPPCHTPTKLYNMGNVISWETDGEHILFLSRPFTHRGAKVRACPDDSWEVSPLRCVHTRFLKRSSKEDRETIGRRLHGEDKLGFGSRVDRGGIDHINKRLMYRRGDLVTKEAGWL